MSQGPLQISSADRLIVIVHTNNYRYAGAIRHTEVLAGVEDMCTGMQRVYN